MLEKFQNNSGNQLFVNEGYAGNIMDITNSNVIKSIAKQESARIKTLTDNFNTEYNDIKVHVGKGSSKVELVDEGGAIMVVNLEDHVHREIMDYVSSLR